MWWWPQLVQTLQALNVSGWKKKKNAKQENVPKKEDKERTRRLGARSVPAQAVEPERLAFRFSMDPGDTAEGTLDALREYVGGRLSSICDQADATLLRDKLTNPDSRVSDSQVKTGNVHLIEEILLDRVIFSGDIYPLKALETLLAGQPNPYAFLKDLYTEFSLSRPADTDWPSYVSKFIGAQKPQLDRFLLKIADRKFILGRRALADVGKGGQQSPVFSGSSTSASASAYGTPMDQDERVPMPEAYWGLSTMTWLRCCLAAAPDHG